MSERMLCVLFVCCSLMILVTAWLYADDKEQNDVNNPAGKPSSTFTETTLDQHEEDQPQFEMESSDKKFLMQANFEAGLSPLEICHHQVISSIKMTCSELPEEELSKLAVNLLNCQLTTEGRTSYPCTPEMSIKECTYPMDPVMWNGYQIVSNRARAICYASRQHEFRMKTEHSVNKLARSAHEQLMLMKVMKDGQEELKVATSETLSKLQEGQKDLLEQQDLLDQQVSGNIRKLTQEKELISSGHQQLADMTERIKEKLDRTSEQIMNQGDEQKLNQKEILEDLAKIKEKAEEVFSKLDENNRQVQGIQEETKLHYRDTIQNLQKVNNTISYIHITLTDMKTALEEKINWLLTVIGATGDSVTIILVIVLHMGYFLLTSMLSVFLQTPVFSRLVLLLVVPLNAWSEIKQGKSLNFVAMTMFICFTVIANWIVGWLAYITISLSSRTESISNHIQPLAVTDGLDKTKNLMDESCVSTSNSRETSFVQDGLKRAFQMSPDLKKLVSVLDKLYKSGGLTPQGTPHRVATPNRGPGVQSFDSGMEDKFNSPAAGDSIKQREMADCGVNTSLLYEPMPSPVSAARVVDDHTDVSAVDDVRRHLLATLEGTPKKRSSSKSSSTSTPIKEIKREVRAGTPKSGKGSTRNSRAGTPMEKHQCLATAKSGLPCKRTSVHGSAFCYLHQVTPTKYKNSD